MRQSERLAEEGKTPLFFAEDKLFGMIAVADVISSGNNTCRFRFSFCNCSGFVKRHNGNFSRLLKRHCSLKHNAIFCPYTISDHNCYWCGKPQCTRARASRVGEDTTLSQIIRMVSDAAATKAPIAKVADRVSGVFVPAVIVIALITIFIWLLTGQTIGFALARGISVLLLSQCHHAPKLQFLVIFSSGLSAHLLCVLLIVLLTFFLQ